MKKLIGLVLALILVIGMMSCSETTIGNQDQENFDDVQNQSSTAPENTETKTVYEQFEKALTDGDHSYEKTVMVAELIGAKEGVKYKIGEGAIELYVFDELSDAYKTANDKQALTMEGFGDFPAIVNNGMALMVSDLNATVFESMFLDLVK